MSLYSSEASDHRATRFSRRDNLHQATTSLTASRPYLFHHRLDGMAYRTSGAAKAIHGGQGGTTWEGRRFPRVGRSSLTPSYASGRHRRRLPFFRPGTNSPTSARISPRRRSHAPSRDKLTSAAAVCTAGRGHDGNRQPSLRLVDAGSSPFPPPGGVDHLISRLYFRLHPIHPASLVRRRGAAHARASALPTILSIGFGEKKRPEIPQEVGHFPPLLLTQPFHLAFSPLLLFKIYSSIFAPHWPPPIHSAKCVHRRRQRRRQQQHPDQTIQPSVDFRGRKK